MQPCLTFHMDLKDSNSGLLSRRKSALIHGGIFPAPLDINTWNLEGFGVFFSQFSPSTKSNLSSVLVGLLRHPQIP